MKMETILDEYYSNHAAKLHKIVDKILLAFGGLSDKDLDDFYSLANEVFVDAMRRYDHSQAFDGFLYSCLSNKIKTEMTRRNREKRKADRLAVSIDMPVGEDEEVTLADIIPDRFTIEKEIFEEKEERYSKKVLLYLARLSNIQRDVLFMTADGYLPGEIRKRLRITKKQYADCNTAIHSYRNISALL
ncbi:MAG: hypothetical protein HFE83_11965 [Lachnospiraceae bacterium]|nr:hypothetical protein [Lachnospiraceae bacterium]